MTAPNPASVRDDGLVDASGVDRAALLAALYNRAQPQGTGFLHYDPTPMSQEQAAVLLERNTHDGSCYFDYLHGRVMKIDVLEEPLDPWLYDRDNGRGAVAAVVEAVRRG